MTDTRTAEETTRYDALAARYRAALVKVLRETGNPATAARLEKVTVMDPARDRLAWTIADMADPRAIGISHQAASRLPELWEGSIELDDLEGTVTELEALYPPSSAN